MYQYRDDTLAYFKNSIMLKNRSVADVNCKRVAAYFKTSVLPKFGEDCPDPESAAIRFYLLNHVFSELQRHYHLHEPMKPIHVDFARDYLQALSQIGSRLFQYILLITTREARHMHSTAAKLKTMEKNFGAEFLAFHQKTHGKGSLSVAQRWITDPPDMSLGQYLKGLVWVFDKGSFSGGYGGKPWANIAETGYRYVTGEVSLELMTDISWALAHNNGPMFNKGMLFEGYHGKELITLLDVQRSGQIPNLIHSVEAGEYHFAHIAAPDEWEKVRQAFPEFDKPIDWFAVEKLGAVQVYTSYKQQQVNLHGAPEISEAEKKAKELILKKQKEAEANKVWISASEFVMKSQRKKAA